MDGGDGVDGEDGVDGGDGVDGVDGGNGVDGGDGEGGGMESVGNGKKSVLRRGERCTQNVRAILWIIEFLVVNSLAGKEVKAPL